MGGVELNHAGKDRKCTGNAFLVVIHNKKASTFKEVIEKHIMAGTTIWHDGHASYGWLRDNAMYPKSDKVIHRKGQFSKKNADGEIVSTNAIEGLFGRTKKMLRKLNARAFRKASYGLFLAEFLWRTKFLSQSNLGDDVSWFSKAFWELLRVLRVECKPSGDNAWRVGEGDDDWSELVSQWQRLKVLGTKGFKRP